MTVIAIPETPPTSIICPSWCARSDHHADVVDAQNPPIHYGPDFGVFSTQALGDEKLYVTVYESIAALTASQLHQASSDARAAAKWLEAQQ